jgi:hypothetical protein
MQSEMQHYALCDTTDFASLCHDGGKSACSPGIGQTDRRGSDFPTKKNNLITVLDGKTQQQIAANRCRD